MCAILRIVAGSKRLVKGCSRGARALSCTAFVQAMDDATPKSEVGGTTGKIRVNGVDLYWERYGTGEHALLCIPGAVRISSEYSTLSAIIGILLCA